jgi:DNA-binding LacI/PurR family transcriptional regulator
VSAQRPTLHTVARAAGVSRQTVSNALNAPERVRPATLTRIRAAIDDLGYRPSLAARQLRTSRSSTLGLRLEPTRDGISGSVLDRFLHALVEDAQAAQYRVLLYTARSDSAEISSYADLLSASQLDGFVLTSTHHGDPRTAWLTDRGVPFSTFGRPWGAERDHHAWVDVDGAAGTEQAVVHLAMQGHRRIAFVGWPGGSGVGDDRRAGWRRGLLAAGLSPVDLEARGLDIAVEDSVIAGAGMGMRLLSVSEPPTAIVCASDSLALGVLRAVDRAVGACTAVVGFDDTPIAAAVGLTSVAQPLAEAARECLQQVLAGISGDTHRPGTALLAPRLVVRPSSQTPV